MSTAPPDPRHRMDEAPDPGSDRVVGVLLAAGAGRRAGGPKALCADPDGTSWLLRSIVVLRDGGCPAVVVVLGSAADRARAIIADDPVAGRDDGVGVVVAADWADGMGASLRAGLGAARSDRWRGALVHLVDLPDVSASVVRRVLAQAPAGADALARATYDGRPGHPVLLGRDHLAPVIEDLAGDRGAGDYLARHGVHGVECGDLATGRDRDEPGAGSGSGIAAARNGGRA